MENKLEEADVRSVIAMLGEALSGDGDFSAMRTQLSEGIAKLTGASAWFWSRGSGGSDEHGAPVQPKVNILASGGFTNDQLAAYGQALRHPDMAWITAPLFRLSAGKRERITRTRQQIHRVEEVERVGASNELERAGIGPILLSFREASPSVVSSFSQVRPRGEPEFTERDARITHIILSEVEWMHEKSWPKYPDESLSSLPLQFTDILNLLVAGHSEKSMSSHLRQDKQTVAENIQAICQHFRVDSRAELVRRITCGDGGDNSPED